MENKDLPITNILVDNENSIGSDEFKPNPFQRDALFERSKSKAKKDLNKFLFNTAQLKINKKLTINNSKSKINKFDYDDKKELVTEEKENINTIYNNKNTEKNIPKVTLNNKNTEKDISDKINDSMTEFKDAKEHYSIIIPDDSIITENNKNTESFEPKTENILESSLYKTKTSNTKKSITADEIFKRNKIESKQLENLVNSLGNMNENVKKRIISHISKSPNVSSSSTYGIND